VPLGQAETPRFCHSTPLIHRPPREVISVVVRRCLRYSLSYRDVEQLPTERDVSADHVNDRLDCSFLPSTRLTAMPEPVTANRPITLTERAPASADPNVVRNPRSTRGGHTTFKSQHSLRFTASRIVALLAPADLVYNFNVIDGA